jgi:diguanylate cyclase (GGDEF)-like protein/PAS domain S-box-containing protein
MAKEQYSGGLDGDREQQPGTSSEFDLLWRAEMERVKTDGILGSLHLNQYELKKVLDGIPLPVFAIDTAHTVINWNKACERITGISSKEMLGRNDPWRGFFQHERPVLADFIVNSSSEEEIAYFYGSQYIRSEIFPEIYIGEDFFPELAPDGVWLSFSASPLRDEQENIIGAIEILMDITQRKEAEARIYQLAYFDELTGLPNRWLFHERLKLAMEGNGPSGLKAAVLLVDINRLRAANDALGQQAGDELIREVGNRLGQTLGEMDTIARVSGDEFMILAHGIASAKKAYELCQRILDRIDKPFNLHGSLIYPDASISFTLLPHEPTAPETLINQADSAMSGAKKKTDKIQGFSEQDESVSREFYLEHDLKRALKNEEFLVYYQPQIDFRTGRILGVEALLRWNHPEKGIVAPSEFIPVLERIGMIAATDQWVLHKVCEQLRSWQAEGLFLNASVNLSAQELNSERIIRVIREALNRTGLHGSYLEIELTESEIMGNVQQASEILRTLSDWGIRIALDDFGKGYSCMSYLQQLPISIIKIDKEFVDGLPGREDSVTLVQTIVAMAHNLGKKALAEGVESESQARILRELGCDYGQGFLWGRPRPHEYLVLRGYL